MRQDLIDLLEKIIGDEPLSDELRSRALEVLAKVLDADPTSSGTTSARLHRTGGGRGVAGAAGTSAGTRCLVYIHGICRHIAGFSTPWWNSLSPFVGDTFGTGDLGHG